MKQLFISHLLPRRVAVLEDGRLEELYVEGEHNTTGNIYHGRVSKVIPALQAAFVDIGTGKHAFLHQLDVHADALVKGTGADKSRQSIADLLHPDQEILVQVVKPATENRGCAVSTFLSIPGRYLVLWTGREDRLVSQSISDEPECQRIADIVESFACPAGTGLIVRQSAVGRTGEELRDDFSRLPMLWEDIEARFRRSTGQNPQPLYEENDLVVRTIRDIYDESFQEIWFDDEEAYRRGEAFLRRLDPLGKCRVALHHTAEPLFSRFEIDQKILELSQRQIDLPHGGSIVIDRTESITAISVRSGSTYPDRALEELVLITNLEAASEIARQLKLRNLSGIAVIDFIDLPERQMRRELEKSLSNATRQDPGVVNFLPVSAFGLVELVRKGVRSFSSEIDQFSEILGGRAPIFISYRRRDARHQVGRIHDWLSSHFGKENIFFDLDIPFGVDWRRYLRQSIQRCTVVLVLIGDYWLEEMRNRRNFDEDVVHFEIEVALQHKKTIIPLLVGDAGMPTPDDLPPGLQKLPDQNGMDIRAGRDFESDIMCLIRRLKELGICPILKSV